MKRIILALLLVGVCWPSAYGVDMIIVDEDFESYADDAELSQEWFLPGVNARLVDENLFPDAFPEGGKGVEHTGGTVVDWLGFDDPVQQPPLVPSETQSIVVRADLFDDGLGNTANKRMTLGLRAITPFAANILELGFYNSNSCDPTVCGPGEVTNDAPQNAVPATPGFYPGTGYAYRMQLYAGIDDPLLLQPDWQYFQLPQELDRTPAGPVGDYSNNDVNDAADYTTYRDLLGQEVTLPNEDPNTTPGRVTEEDRTVWSDNFGAFVAPNGLINSFDVGPGWHRYQATITPTEITVEIDLYRDGLRNTSMTPDPMTGIRPGTPGVDASQTWPVISNVIGYDSIRFGGPSNLSSAGGGIVFDNIYLALEDVPMAGGGAVGGSNVPEPATAWLSIVAVVAALAIRRRR